MNERLRALNRFGLGARAGDLEAQVPAPPREWLRAQLEPGAALLTGGNTALPTLAEIGAALARQREARASTDPGERQAAQQALRELMRRESLTALGHRLSSEAPFVERLVGFWSNHLCVSAAANPVVAALAGHYERTVVRPHVLGRFEEMLLASARHPAMLVYLDNTRSIGPASPAARAPARRGSGRGLNENYARELLELHTLGVDGGYDQRDVEAAARILTGWTAELGRGRPGFAFRPALHEPGPKTVLGRRYGGGGVGEGEALVRDLARHPSTATFLATKLARHFVADEPLARAGERLAEVYRDTDGDLLELSRTLVDLDEAWDPAHRKLRTPQEWIVAGLRALRADRYPPPLLGALQQLRQPLWAPPAPKGFDDLARPWSDPDSLMSRAELARSVARGIGGGPGRSAGRSAPERPGAGAAVRRPETAPLDPRLLLTVMEPADGGALASMLADPSIDVDERIALVLGGPAFQWR